MWTWDHGWAEPVQVAGLADVRQVEVGLYNVYARTGGGTVFAWGDNRQGQAGNGTVGGVDCIEQSPRPENCWFDEPRPVTGLSGVTSIGADAGHGFAVTADGRAWSWGSNYRGGLGQGLDCDCPSGTPAPIAGLTNARTITGFQDGGYALDADGRVWAWGDNEMRSLGQTDGTQPGLYSTVPVRLAAPTGVTAVAGGFNSGFALVP